MCLNSSSYCSVPRLFCGHAVLVERRSNTFTLLVQSEVAGIRSPRDCFQQNGIDHMPNHCRQQARMPESMLECLLKHDGKTLAFGRQTFAAKEIKNCCRHGDAYSDHPGFRFASSGLRWLPANSQARACKAMAPKCEAWEPAQTLALGPKPLTSAVRGEPVEP